MTGQVSHDVLRRMVSPPPPAPEDVPITSSRAMRLAMTRAADQAHGLELAVTSLREEVQNLDTMLGAIAADMMLVGMVDDTRTLLGICAVDAGLRSALIEVQTVGSVLVGEADDRPPTGTDAKMTEPLLEAVLARLKETTPRTPLDGWGDGLAPLGRVADTRSAGLILPEGPYRVIQMVLDLRVEGRTGTLMMALPDHTVITPQILEEGEEGDWSTRFQTAVNAAPVRLEAELHRFHLPLYAIEAMAVDQVIPLVGCDLASVTLRAVDGRKVAAGRLGQAGGMRAVRVEQSTGAEADTFDQLEGDAGGGLALMSDEAALAGAAFGGDDTGMGGFGGDPAMGEMGGDGDAFGLPMDDAGADMGFDVAPAMPAGAGDETTRMLDEMEAAIADEPSGELSWDDESGDAAALDWSAELDPAAGDDS